MKHIRFFAALLALAMALTACSPSATQQEPEATAVPQPSPAAAESPAGQESEVGQPNQEALFTLDDYPVVDGSTANLPLMAAVLAKTAGISQEQAEALTSCSKTPQSYSNLVEGLADILLVYEPAEETRLLIEESGVELEFTPIGRDALVFIVNESNPVEGLTTGQLTDIYTGKLKNWKDVGGEDREIIPFQRASASGSQALFMKLLMDGAEPMDPPKELAPSEMGELIERLAEYNDDGGALGYSVYYYANYMYSKPGLKFLAVDGVTPSDDTIADGSYPFINEFYAVVRADAPKDSPERKLLAWLTTPEGVQCMADAGYIPVPQAQ